VKPTLVGRVVIPGSVPAFSSGTLQVWLEDVSYADRAATVVAEATISGVSHVPARVAAGDREETVVRFSLVPSQEIDPTRDYSVRATLTVPAGVSQEGLRMDSDQSYPVLTRGFGAEVTVVLDNLAAR
jgi:uncharacterized lipoprotein YbaY